MRSLLFVTIGLTLQLALCKPSEYEDFVTVQEFGADASTVNPREFASRMSCDITLISDSGSYGTDGYPDSEYPSDQNCKITIEPSSGESFTVLFDFFLLQSSFLCRSDHVTIEVDGLLHGEYCGFQAPFEVEADSRVDIIFVSDSSKSATGFHFTYSTENPSGGASQVNSVASGPFAKCGQTPEIEGKIVNGNESEAHSWPWIVNIMYGEDHLCGGSVYDLNHVITAAHCFPYTLDLTKYTIFFGDHDTDVAEVGQLERKVASVDLHELYLKKTMDNDIAVVHLDRPITFSKTVRPVCLPDAEIEVGTAATVSGWGNSEDTMDETSLNEAIVPVIERSVCNGRTWYKGKITENMVCAGYPNGVIDSCQGDSGGPLVSLNGDRYVLNGVVSWGHGCAEAKKPGVYTNVVNYIDWIKQKMNTL